MSKLEISQNEKELLRGYNKTSPLVLVRLKSQAVLMRSKDIKLADISDIVERDVRTISSWLHDWQSERMASIFTGHANNENASKLTKVQKEDIRNVLLQPPSVQGIPKEFWDVPQLKNYIRATFGVVYESPQSYHFLLSFSNLSFKYPDTFDLRRDEAQITERMKEIQQEITPLLNDDSWEIFASDEVRMELEALTRRAWLKRGERTIVKVNRQREAQSYIGFLNQKSFQCHLYEMDWQNQEEVLKALNIFLKEYPGKRICIIWDNARFHKGKKIREALKRGGSLERVHLINFPPYAPDHNPIEHVWNVGKGAVANVQYENFKAMKSGFHEYIDGRKFKYVI